MVWSVGSHPTGGWTGGSTKTARAMEDIDRQRTLEYFERLGKERVRLYAAIDCERFLGGWQVRELADQWLDAKEAEKGGRPLWRRLGGLRGTPR